MGLEDRVAQIRAYEDSKQAREKKARDEEIKAHQDENRAREAEEHIAIEANAKIVLPLLDITDARSSIREVQQIWEIGEVHESHHIRQFLHQSSASVSLSHSFLEIEPLYRGYLDEGTDIGPRVGTRIFESGVSLSISVHTSGSGTGRPHAIVSYDKYKKTNGADFPQGRVPRHRQTANEPWGSQASTNDRIGRPLVYGLKWVDIITEDPKRTRDDVEGRLAVILSRVGSPKCYDLKAEDLDGDPFVPGDVKRQLFPRTQHSSALPWYKRILG